MAQHSIQPLSPENWQGHEIMFKDYAENCYHIDVAQTDGGFNVSLQKRPLGKRKKIEYPEKLFQPWLKDVKAWGIIENGKLIAVIETSAGDRNRLYISELWVDERYRRLGIAKSLMDTAKKRAKDEKFRAIFLETRSCNEHAISFYISQGFTLIGFDTCVFSNEDIENYSVPLKFGYFMK
jgi:hypothetical protein